MNRIVLAASLVVALVAAGCASEPRQSGNTAANPYACNDSGEPGDHLSQLSVCRSGVSR